MIKYFEHAEAVVKKQMPKTAMLFQDAYNVPPSLNLSESCASSCQQKQAY